MPLAVTDCLNFGSPEDPGVMWQFQQAVHGLADGCAELGIPVTGGNVSFYNQTGSRADPAHAGGRRARGHRRRPPADCHRDRSRAPGETLFLLGETRDELDGSEWANVVHGHLGGGPRRWTWPPSGCSAEILLAGRRDGMVSAAHDLSEGGLAQALVEMCLISDVGARSSCPNAPTRSSRCSPSRRPGPWSRCRGPRSCRFTAMCTGPGQPWTRIGVVDAVDPDGHHLDIQGVARLALPDLRAAWEGTLPALFGPGVAAG